MGYSQSIRGVFTGYSYVSVMCRLCIGYLSEHTRRGGGLIQISCNFDDKNLKEIESPARCAHEILINPTYKVINSPVRLTPVVGVTRGPHIATLRALNLK